MQDDDATIDALIRALRRESDEAAAQLPDEVVHAYLTGRATAKEKSLVRRALVQSPQFRQELIAMSDYLETLSTEGVARAYDAASAPPLDADDLSPARQTVSEPTFWERATAAVQRMVSMPRLVPSMAAAAAVAFLALGVAPRLSWSPMVAPSLTTDLDPTSFTRPWAIRGDETFGSHEEAAQYALHGCLQLGQGGLEVTPGPAPQPGSTPPLATLHLVGRWRQKLQVVRIPRPALLDAAAILDDLDHRVWVAALPQSLEEPIGLRSFVLRESKTALAWDQDRAQRGILVVTFEAGGRFHASSCLPFALDSQ